MTKLFHFIVIIGMLSIISSCNIIRSIPKLIPSVLIPLNIEGTNTNIIEIPVDTNNIRMEIKFVYKTDRCLIYLNLPNDCKINEDSLDITFNVHNYSRSKVEAGELSESERYYVDSKISPSHYIDFVLRCEDTTIVQDVPIHMYLKMSGVIVKKGKSLINDTIIVNIPQGIPRPNRNLSHISINSL